MEGERFDAVNSTNNNYVSALTNQVCNANKAVHELFSVTEEKNKLQNLATNATRKEMRSKSKGRLIIIVLLACLGIPAYLFLPVVVVVGEFESILIDSGVVTNTAGLDVVLLLFICIFFTLLAISIVIMHIILRTKNSKKNHELAEKYQKLVQEKESYINEIIKVHSHELEIIPVQYRYPLATSYIEEVFINGRASTIPEALDKFEEQVHRWNMESSMQQNLALQAAQTKILHDIRRDIWIDIILSA